MTAMGVTQVTATVRNPGNPKKSWQGLFHVDTGAIDCLVPGKHLRALGIKPRAKRAYELANGKEITCDVAAAEIEFLGDRVGATVVFGPDDADPILGVTALESVGIEVDPRSQRRKRLPAVRLKARRARQVQFPAQGRRQESSWPPLLRCSAATPGTRLTAARRGTRCRPHRVDPGCCSCWRRTRSRTCSTRW
jgi:clan AA aspartic protease